VRVSMKESAAGCWNVHAQGDATCVDQAEDKLGGFERRGCISNFSIGLVMTFMLDSFFI
jgi:hypothetical protein